MKTSNLKILSPKYLEVYSCEIDNDFIRNIGNFQTEKEFSVKDFEFYLVSSALYSSKIEGSSLDLNSFYRNRGKGNKAFRPKEVQEIEDLVSAYKFASQNKLTQKNFLNAHKILSKGLVIRSLRGAYRRDVVGVWSINGLVYQAMEWDLVPKIMDKLFNDIRYLIKSKMSTKEVFYYASMIHLWIAMIHPFMDGNGRSARLLEKWFLSEKLGKTSWSIKSETYYWNHHSDYSNNINLGFDYYHIDWDKCMPFLIMLTHSLSEE